MRSTSLAQVLDFGLKRRTFISERSLCRSERKRRISLFRRGTACRCNFGSTVILPVPMKVSPVSPFRKGGRRGIFLLFFFLFSIFYFPVSAVKADTSFTAGEGISAGNILVLQNAANTVYKTSAQGQTGIVGVAANEAGAGTAVYVRQFGGKVPVTIVGTVTKGNVLRASATAGAAENAGGMTAGAFAIAATDGSGGQCTATLMLGLQGSGTIGSHSHTESDISDLEHDAQKVKGKTLDDAGLADGKIWKYQASSSSWVIADDAGASTGAPVGAPYITQTHDATLTNEHALSDLATGLLKNTTATGVLEIAVAGADYAAANHNHSASDIPDFDTEVSNNTDVAANTAARHSQGMDQGLDTGGPNAVTAAQAKTAYAHSQATGNTHGLTYTAEGPGGGLDADTVDNFHAADFATAGHNHDSDYGSLSGESAWSGTQDFSGATVIGIGNFVDRGDPSAHDFAVGDLTTDGSWHDLDLSGIVPAGAKAVLLGVQVIDDTVNVGIGFRRHGNSYGINAGYFMEIVANGNLRGTLIVPCDSNRVIEYLANNNIFSTINITVMGWFI
jgi:hypothetical protein